MTEYFENSNGVVTDFAGTVGIHTRESLPDECEPEWVTGMNPQILRDMANLIEFCYPDKDCVDVGLSDPMHGSDVPIPSLVVGDADADRWVWACPNVNCEAAPGDEEDMTLGEFHE